MKKNKTSQIYLFKVNYGNTRRMCELYSILAIRYSGVCFGNLEKILPIILLFSLFILNKKMQAGRAHSLIKQSILKP